jgi:hypothetical protein
MPLYLWNGQLLGRNGSLAKSDACCCDGDGCPPCCDCETYTFTISGVTGGGDCADVNDTYEIHKIGATCSWTGEGVLNLVDAVLEQTSRDSHPPCGKFRLSIGPILVPADTAVYEIDVLDWDCEGPNVLTYVSSSPTGCTDWPETIEVTCAD